MVEWATRSKPIAGSMHRPRRLPQPIRDVLRFTLIGAVVGAGYGHMMAVIDGSPLLGIVGLPRGVLTGVVITSILFSFERALEHPAMAPLRRTPFLVHLVIKTVVYLVVILFGLVIGSQVISGAVGDGSLAAD